MRVTGGRFEIFDIEGIVRQRVTGGVLHCELNNGLLIYEVGRAGADFAAIDTCYPHFCLGIVAVGCNKFQRAGLTVI